MTRSASIVTLALSLFVLSLGQACGTSSSSEASPRCAHCGMRVDPGSTWRAGLTGSDGAELAFDAPKCLFRVLRQQPGAREPWVLEYYSSERRSASEVVYVIGSDVQSPMGQDLVPLSGREQADRFARDHGGRVLGYDEVSAELVDGLFGGGHHQH